MMSYNYLRLITLFLIALISACNNRDQMSSKLMHVISVANSGRFDEAIDTLSAAHQAGELNDELYFRAELAIRLARIANQLDRWEGSDFGKATPWYGVGNFDKDLNKVPESFGEIAYFNKIIEHSIQRLEKVRNRVE